MYYLELEQIISLLAIINLLWICHFTGKNIVNLLLTSEYFGFCQ